MTKTKKQLAMKNITGIFLAVTLAVSLLCGQTPEIAGVPFSYFLLLMLIVVYAGCWIWNIRRGASGLWRLEYRTDFVVLALVAWNLLSIAGKMFQDPDTGAIHYEFQAVWIILGLLYFVFKEARMLEGWYLDLLLCVGLLMAGRILMEDLGLGEFGWRPELMADSGTAASLLLLPCLVSTLRYCFCRSVGRSLFYALTAMVSYFALFVNCNVSSLWIMTFAFLAIPLMVRPTAELVKRDMQMFFLYGVLLSGTSFLTNYMRILSAEPAFGPEHSIYLLLLLAVGGVFFIRYWSRIPKGVDRDRLVLRRMRRGYQFVFVLLGIVAAILLLGGSVWAGLPETSVGIDFVQSFAGPLTKSVGMSESGWIRCLRSSRVSTLLLLVLAVLLTLDMQRKSSFARPRAAGCRLIAYAFLAQTFFYTPDRNVLPVYLLFFVWAVFYREPVQRVSVTRINFHYNKEKTGNAKKNHSK